MQRQEPDGVVLACDFCHRDWDGQEAMIEGHHGSILCLECLKIALANRQPPQAPYRCTLCLKEKIPTDKPCWTNPEHPDATVCQDCIYQAAGVFTKSPLTTWEWDRKK